MKRENNGATRKSADLRNSFGLNGQQGEVLENLGCNCAINAGAGTGKTKTLTAAYIQILLENQNTTGQKIQPENIVAITFTKAAAEELRSRITKGLLDRGEQELAEAMSDSWISTINAFCSRVLKNEDILVAQLFGLDRKSKVLSDKENQEISERIIARILSKEENSSLIIGDKDFSPHDYLDKETVIKAVLELANKIRLYDVNLDDISFKEVEVALRGYEYIQKHKALTNYIVFLTRQYIEAYAKAKAELGVIDFTDQILFTKWLFERKPEVAKRYKEQFYVILIDEFQDTNFAQFEIFKRISRGNITVVGDKKQSIYAFQGADVEVFDSVLAKVRSPRKKGRLNASNQMTDDEYIEVKLQKNYRSHPDVIEFINKVFENPELFGEEYLPLDANEEYEEINQISPGDKRIQCFACDVQRRDADIVPMASEQIALEFKRLKEEEGYAPGEMVVLAPKRKQLLKCAQALRKQGFYTTVKGGNVLFSDPSVRGMCSVLKSLDNVYDDAALVEAALTYLGRVSDEELAKANQLVESGRKHLTDKNLWHAFCVCAKSHPQSSLGVFTEIFETALKKMGIEPLGNIARYIFIATGYSQLLTFSEDDLFTDFSNEESYANVLAFFKLLDAWDREGLTARAIVSRLQSIIEHEDKFDFGSVPVGLNTAFGVEQTHEKDAVRLMTIHNSKGLEFPVVALMCSEKKSHSSEIGILERRSPEGKSVLEVALSRIKNLAPREWKEINNAINAKIIKKTKAGLSGKARSYKSTAAEALKESNNIKEKEELLRLFYVGMTRAQERLCVAYASSEPKDDKALSPVQKVSFAIDAYMGEFGEDSVCARAFLAPPENADTSSENSGASKEENDLAESSEEESLSLIEQENARKGCLDREWTNAPAAFSVKVTPATEWASWKMPAQEGSGSGVQGRKVTLEEVTASGIERYKTCPRQFYLSAIARVGLFASSDNEQAANRGTAMHAVLEYYAQEMLGKTKKQFEDVQNIAPKIKRLFDLSEEETQKVMASALKIIESNLWDVLSACETVQTESQFYEELYGAGNKEEATCECGPDKFYLHGYIDVCGKKKDGSWLVLDYKSGKGRATAEKYAVQARCYALVLLRRGAPQVNVVFVRPEVSGGEGVYDFETFEFDYSQADIYEIEQEIIAARLKMQQAGAVDECMLNAMVDSSACSNCSYRGSLCKGVH